MSVGVESLPIDELLYSGLKVLKSDALDGGNLVLVVCYRRSRRMSGFAMAGRTRGGG